MDLLYMSENFNYYSARGAIYDKYEYLEKPKVKGFDKRKEEKTQEGSSNNTKNLKVKEPNFKTKPQGQTTKHNCQLCRENQKRVLSNYIRSKSIECAKKDGILEESEE